MKILADECLPIRIKNVFSDFNLSTVNELGWSGLKNGELLNKAINENFEIFLTVDQKIIYQQNISNYSIAFVIISVKQNKLEEIIQLKDLLAQCFQKVNPFEIVLVDLKNGITKLK